MELMNTSDAKVNGGSGFSGVWVSDMIQHTIEIPYNTGEIIEQPFTIDLPQPLSQIKQVWVRCGMLTEIDPIATEAPEPQLPFDYIYNSKNTEVNRPYTGIGAVNMCFLIDSELASLPYIAFVPSGLPRIINTVKVVSVTDIAINMSVQYEKGYTSGGSIGYGKFKYKVVVLY